MDSYFKTENFIFNFEASVSKATQSALNPLKIVKNVTLTIVDQIGLK